LCTCTITSAKHISKQLHLLSTLEPTEHTSSASHHCTCEEQPPLPTSNLSTHSSAPLHAYLHLCYTMISSLFTISTPLHPLISTWHLHLCTTNSAPPALHHLLNYLLNLSTAYSAPLQHLSTTTSSSAPRTTSAPHSVLKSPAQSLLHHLCLCITSLAQLHLHLLHLHQLSCSCAYSAPNLNHLICTTTPVLLHF
jgi:hypothetical protein